MSIWYNLYGTKKNLATLMHTFLKITKGALSLGPIVFTEKSYVSIFQKMVWTREEQDE
jgi:hypothetical protein